MDISKNLVIFKKCTAAFYSFIIMKSERYIALKIALKYCYEFIDSLLRNLIDLIFYFMIQPISVES